MKKIVISLIFALLSVGLFAQKKINALPVVTSAIDASLIYVRSGASGAVVSAITKANFLQSHLLIADSSSTEDGHFATGKMLANGLKTKLSLTDTVPLTDVAVMLNDQKSTLAFGVGSGDAADTTSLSTTRKYGPLYWGGHLTFHVDSMCVQLIAGAGLDTIGVQINWSDTLAAVVPTTINSAALAVGRISGTNVARTIGQFDVAFANAIIPPGKHVWMSLPYIPAASLKRKPSMVSVTLIGHLQ
jgi:hypothetical protein